MADGVEIQSNLEKINKKIEDACVKAGRNADEVKLIAVSKTKPMDLIREAFKAGQVDFGENRVQELREKHPELPDGQWHLIGTLQRNKVKYIAPFVHLIHSVDSEKLLQEIDKQAGKNDRVIDCLLQMNISDEDNKHGLGESDVEAILSHIDQYPNIRIKGFMGMAEFTDDAEIVRQQFRRLRIARDSFRAKENSQIQLDELSMGMSGDFPIAIEEGATMVRVGSAIFGIR
ncbi:MAG: YggS family pyridoxal phosphate-dependent enzyme [Bacteroidia bacterium]|nr:YggS family pyridoxal phosphate-dependent enzyme [Bacteroidia bacterium]